MNGQKVYYNDVENEMLRLEGFSDTFTTPDKTIKIGGDSHKTDFYKGVKELFLDDKLSKEEFEIVKEQCLNMADDSDRDFAKFMESTLMSVDDI